MIGKKFYITMVTIIIMLSMVGLFGFFSSALAETLGDFLNSNPMLLEITDSQIAGLGLWIKIREKWQKVKSRKKEKPVDQPVEGPTLSEQPQGSSSDPISVLSPSDPISTVSQPEPLSTMAESEPISTVSQPEPISTMQDPNPDYKIFSSPLMEKVKSIKDKGKGRERLEDLGISESFASGTSESFASSVRLTRPAPLTNISSLSNRFPTPVGPSSSKFFTPGSNLLTSADLGLSGDLSSSVDPSSSNYVTNVAWPLNNENEEISLPATAKSEASVLTVPRMPEVPAPDSAFWKSVQIGKQSLVNPLWRAENPNYQYTKALLNALGEGDFARLSKICEIGVEETAEDMKDVFDRYNQIAEQLSDSIADSLVWPHGPYFATDEQIQQDQWAYLEAAYGNSEELVNLLRKKAEIDIFQRIHKKAIKILKELMEKEKLKEAAEKLDKSYLILLFIPLEFATGMFGLISPLLGGLSVELWVSICPLLSGFSIGLKLHKYFQSPKKSLLFFIFLSLSRLMVKLCHPETINLFLDNYSLFSSIC